MPAQKAVANTENSKRSGAWWILCGKVHGTPRPEIRPAIPFGGGSAIREDSRLERCLRDAHAAAQHFSISGHSNLEPIGRVLLGLSPGTAQF
jgi:hypothetical protein